MANDAFGYSYKYASKPGGESYTLSLDPNTDNRFDAELEVLHNADGSYRFTSDDNVDFSVLTSALFNEDDIIDDHGDLDLDSGGRGYMMNPKDWRDVEINFHWMVEDFSDEDGWYIHLGGGRHSNPQPYCEGCAYIFKVFFNGDIQILKEQWHNHKVPVPYEDTYTSIPAGDFQGETGIIERAIGTPDSPQGGEIRNAWNLMKICRYNIKQNDGSTAVKIEVYMNGNGDKQTWIPLVELLDVHGWGDDDEECNGAPDQVMNWGFPMVKFHWENAENISWFGLVVREIITTTPIPEDPDDEEEPGGGGQPGTPPEQTTGKVSKIGSFRFSIASTLATSCDGVEPTTPPTDPDPPPPGGGPDPPPPAGGVISFKLAEYFRVGSP